MYVQNTSNRNSHAQFGIQIEAYVSHSVGSMHGRWRLDGAYHQRGWWEGRSLAIQEVVSTVAAAMVPTQVEYMSI